MNEEFEKLDRIKRLYNVICRKELGDDPGSLQKRVDIIRYLERELRTEFKSTADFHQKVQAYLAGHVSSPAVRLKRARKKFRLLQAELGALLNCSREFVVQMENSERPLTKKTLEFVKMAELGLSLNEIRERLNSFRINSLGQDQAPEEAKNAVG